MVPRGSDLLESKSAEGRDCCLGHLGLVASPVPTLPVRGFVVICQILALWSLWGFAFWEAKLCV